MSAETLLDSTESKPPSKVENEITTAIAPSEVTGEAETNGAKAEELRAGEQTNAQSDVIASGEPKPESVSNQEASSNITATLTNDKPSDDLPSDSPAVLPVDERAAEHESSSSKLKADGRRKSSGGTEPKKKLSKKASKAALTHTDAKPGDHFFARLKGFPPWPVVICDEVMLPNELIKSRPASAAREDGTYHGEYQDGGSKVKDRQFAIMYLHTNEFGWIRNTDLQELDFETVGNIPGKMRKDLQEAHKLAAEKNDLDYYKQLLSNFMEQMEANLIAQQAAADAKAAKLAAKAKKEKAKSQKIAREGQEDVEMAEVDSDDVGSATKKRKAQEDATPGDSSKKLKLAIKFTAPQTPNGSATSKPAKDSSSSTKSAKLKTKKSTPKPSTVPEAYTPKEPELTSEEKRAKKEKEILFLRHKLQKGLLTRDQPPKEDEMKHMSEFISKLEGYSELEVSIIRATKINKVLKAIIKLSSIPKEDEFKFKSRSQTLLDKWNKLLAGDPTAPAAPTVTNGSSGGILESEVVPTATDPTHDGEGNREDHVSKIEKTIEHGHTKSASDKEGDQAPQAASATGTEREESTTAQIVNEVKD